MYKIIIDSCGELPQNLKEDSHFCNVALSLDIDGEIIMDDENFDQKSFLAKVKSCIAGPKSAHHRRALLKSSKRQSTFILLLCPEN